MVVSKVIHCAVCDKKCSGKVLRYQDQYYHKQCFQLEQSEGKRQLNPSSYSATATTTTNDSTSLISSQQQQQQQHQPIDENDSNSYRSAITSSKSHQILYNNNGNGNTTSSRLIESNNNYNNNNINNLIRQGHSNRLDGTTTTNNNSNTNTSDISGLPSLSRYNHSQMNGGGGGGDAMQSYVEPQQKARGQTLDANRRLLHSPDPNNYQPPQPAARSSATLPHSNSSPANGFVPQQQQTSLLGMRQFNTCAGCKQQIKDGQALIALDLHWHVWCFKCAHCKMALHGEYVAKDAKAYCEKDYQKLFGVTCVYCKRYITGKVLQAGEAHHFHPSCARCSKCGDPFVPGEEMYLQGEVTWHPRCGPGPESTSGLGLMDHESQLLDRSQQQLRSSSRAQSPGSQSSRSRSRSVSPFSYIMSRQQYAAAGRHSPGGGGGAGYNQESETPLGDLSRVYTISYLDADPTQGYLRRPIEPMPPKSPQFSRPTSATRRDHNHNHHHHHQNQHNQHASADRSSRSSSRSNQQYYHYRDRSIPRGMYSVLSSMRSDRSDRARSPSMLNEEAIQSAQYPSGQKPGPDAVPAVERDDFPAPPFPGIRSSSTSRSNLISTNGAADGTETTTSNQQHSLANGQPIKKSVHNQQQRASRPRSREIGGINGEDRDDDDSSTDDPQPLTKEEEELSKIANGIGKIFLQTLKEREKLRAWKRTNLDPRNASRTPSATRELPSRLRYDNPTNASPSRDMDRPRPWEDDDIATGTGTGASGGGGAISREHSPTNRTRSSLGKPAPSSNSNSNSNSYGYKVVQSNRSTPRPGYGLSAGPYGGATESAIYNRSLSSSTAAANHQYNSANDNGLLLPSDGFIKPSELSFEQQQRIAENRSNDLLNRAAAATQQQQQRQSDLHTPIKTTTSGINRPLGGVSAHLRRSMPNGVDHLHLDGPPKLYPYHLLATSNYRLPPDVDRCHLERHLSNEEFQYIFHCDRLDFYRLPAWKRNELKRRVKLF